MKAPSSFSQPNFETGVVSSQGQLAPPTSRDTKEQLMMTNNALMSDASHEHDPSVRRCKLTLA